MIFNKFILFSFIFLSSLSSYSQKDGNNTPLNIILLIGDGMGLSQISASQFYNNNPSNFERFQTIGLIKTSSSNELITDSAAGATAFACGVKTYNGAIGVSQDTIPKPTIIDYVSNRGMSTGLIATSSIVHATPASFFAHTDSRKKYEDIAAFLPNSEIDFFAGGGLQFFENRKDHKNLLLQLSNNGFTIHKKSLPTKTLLGKQAILLAEDGMPTIKEGRGNFLPNATQLALDQLSNNKKGFFLMVEGSQIDWGGHANDEEYLINELLDFDKVIGIALDFAKKNKNTLVIVTADHETGGFTLATNGNNYNKITPVFATGGHSATMVPVFAKGPNEQLFAGIYENTGIYSKMINFLESKKTN